MSKEQQTKILLNCNHVVWTRPGWAKRKFIKCPKCDRIRRVKRTSLAYQSPPPFTEGLIAKEAA